MAKDDFQLAEGAAAIYEAQKVRAIFAPLARATLDRIAVADDELVLDVACGTGIVARSLCDRRRLTAAVVGADLNAGMIETARRLTRDRAEAFRWQVADVADMPFPDAGFTLAICQQGLQFFPDEDAALGELRRVLKPGGRLVLTVWQAPSPFFLAMAESIARHVSEAAAATSLAPFAYAGRAELPERLERIGFAAPQVEEISVDRLVTRPAESIPKEILGNPCGPEVAAKGPATMARIVEEVIAACAAYRRGDDLVVPQVASLFTARAL